MIPILIRGSIAIMLLAGSFFTTTNYFRTQVVELPTPQKQIENIEQSYIKYEQNYIKDWQKKNNDDFKIDDILSRQEIISSFVEKTKFDKLRENTVEKLIDDLELNIHERAIIKNITQDFRRDKDLQKVLIEYYLYSKF